MTLFKWLASFVLTLILLIALAIVIVPRVVDPNDYRDRITSIVKDKTGRDLSLTGDLSVSVFPWLGIRTQGLSLSQPSQIGGEMLSVKTAQLRVKLLPLLKKQVEVDTVVLENPQLRLITLKNGDNSFDGLTGQTTEPTAAEGDDAAAAIALVIQGLELTNGNLLWDDQQTDQRYQVQDLNVVTGNLIGSDLADLKASGTLIDASVPQPIVFELDGRARIDTESLKFMAQNMQAQLQQGEQSVELSLGEVEVDQVAGARVQRIQLNANVIITEQANAPDSTNTSSAKPQQATIAANIEDVNLDFNSGQLSALGSEAKVQAKLREQPALDADITLPNLTFNAQTGRILANSVALNGQFGERKFDLSAPQLAANLQAQTVTLDSLEVRSDDLAVSLKQLKVTQFIDQPSASGQISMQPFNVAKLLQDLAIDYTPADKSALQKVAFSSAFEAGLDNVSLQSMQLELDQSKLTGSFSAKDFTNLAIKFNLVLDHLNLDHYLPLDEATDADDPANAAALAAPMALLKDINANGSFTAGQLISGGLELTDIDVLVASTPGNLTITPKAKLYDGALGGKMAFTASDEQSTLKVNNKIDLVSLAKFLTAADVSEQLSGIGSLDLDIEVTERDGKQSNSGTIKLLAKNGAIKGVDIKNIVDRGYQTYNSLSGKDRESLDEEGKEAEEGEAGKTNSGDETRFAELLGTFYLKDNKLRNDDFLMKAPLFRIAGEGDIDLDAQTLNYLINVSIVNSSDGQGGRALDELKGITIPIRFRGSLTAPSYTLDTKALYQSLAKRKIEERKSEYLQEKLGIEGGGKMSTKELLQQALLNKANKKLGVEEPSDTSIAQPDVAPPSGAIQDVAQPDIAQPDSARARPADTASQSSNAVPDVSANPNAQSEPEKSSKDQLKDDLKERLLDSIFN